MDEIIEKQQELLKLCKPGADQDHVRSALQSLFKISGYEPWGLKVNGDPNIWYRARSFEPGEPIVNNLSGLIYRTVPPTETGRAHIAGRRVFYAAWNAATAFAEVGPKHGGKVQCIQCRVRPDACYHALLIGVIEQLHMSGRSMYPSANLDFQLGKYQRETDPLLVVRRLMVDSFLSSLLRQPDTSTYPVTSILSEYVYEKMNTQGLIYPSVKAFGAANLAIPDYVFDRCFEVVRTATFEVVGAYPYAVYQTKLLGVSDTFSAAGDIDWTPRRPVPPWRVPLSDWTPAPGPSPSKKTEAGGG